VGQALVDWPRKVNIGTHAQPELANDLESGKRIRRGRKNDTSRLRNRKASTGLW
jgi:hypothetical protein